MESKIIIDYLKEFHGIYFVSAKMNNTGSYTVLTTNSGPEKLKDWWLTDDKLLFMNPSTLLSAAEVYVYLNRFSRVDKPEGIRVQFP